MTIPNPAVNTWPHCGACGYDVRRFMLDNDGLCDSCGADVSAFNILEGVTASAGGPGFWSNGGSLDAWPQSTFEDAVANAVASPLTAWSGGQYVWLGDQSNMYWDSAAWQEGKAP